MEMTAKSSIPSELLLQELLTHPILPLSHTQDVLVPRGHRSWSTALAYAGEEDRKGTERARVKQPL